MELVELHILQSFPVTCLNRDDVGAPKTAYFGGCQRARVSSQCWKRAIRLMARDIAAQEKRAFFQGYRTRKAAADLTEELVKRNIPEDEARTVAQEACRSLLEKPKEPKPGTKTEPAKGEPAATGGAETSTLLYLSPSEREAMAAAIAQERNKPPEKRDYTKAAAQAAPQAHLKDAADIAIFGRMVANEPRLTLEGAGLFSHAISTHRCDNDLDFFTAVDDRQDIGEEAGAGMMGTIEFNSACYYRYVGLNLRLLADDHHLNHLNKDERAQVIEAFLKAAILAVPPARKNSMFGFNPPAFIMGLKRTGQPLSLVNAFETPVRASDGYLDPSKEALKKHWEHIKKLYSLQTIAEAELPPDNLPTMLAKLTQEA